MSAELLKSTNGSAVGHRALAAAGRPCCVCRREHLVLGCAAGHARIADRARLGHGPAWFIIALSGWWITAGIGIRLGSVPRDYLGWLGGALGFRRDLKHRSGG